MTRRIGLAALVASCVGCAGPGMLGPSVTDRVATAVTDAGTIGARSSTVGQDSWIFHPAELPPGQIGKNSCTFEFNLDGDPEYHPQDASDPKQSSCWETNRDHEEEFGVPAYREQFRGVHFPALPQCEGGPGDLESIRLCFRDALGDPIRGLTVPACGGRSTGRFGCVECLSAVPDCH